MANHFIVTLILVVLIASISGENLDDHIKDLVNPGPYTDASLYSIQGYRVLAYVGKYTNSYYSHSEVNDINKGFAQPDYNTIKLGGFIYTKTYLSNRRFLNYFVAEHDWEHTKGYLFCGKTNKSILCGTYSLKAEEDTKEKNAEIRELLDQTVRSLVQAGY